MKTRLLTAVALAVAALSLRAGTTNAYVHARNGTEGSPVWWTTASIWSPAEVPDITSASGTNLTATFTYTAPGERKWQQVCIGLNPSSLPDTWSRGPLYLGKLVNGLYSELKWTPTAHKVYRSTLTVDDTTDYLGGLFFDFHTGIEFSGVRTAPTIHHLNITGLTQLCAPAGTEVTVEHAYGFGTFEVNGAKYPARTRTGRYDLSRSPGGLTFATVCNGTLGAVGRAYGTSPALPSDPWLHLDASAEDSLTTYEEGGRTYVSEWRDCEGGSVTATPGSNMPGKPYLAEDEATGLKTVCFGNFNGKAGSFGNAARCDLSQKTAAAKEIFAVFRDNTPSNVFHFVGGTLTAQFARTDTPKVLFTPPTQRYGSYTEDVELFFGEVRCNGNVVEPNFQDDFSRRLNVVSAALRSGSSPNVSCIGGPANGSTDRAGGGALAELLVYTRSLTPEERREACAYLAKKWRPDLFDWDYGTLYLLNSTARFDVLSGTAAVRELRLPDADPTIVKWGPGTLEIGSTTVTNLRVTVNEGAVRFGKPCEIADDPQPAADPVVWMDATKTASFKGFTEGGRLWVTNWSDCRGANFRGDRYNYQTPVDILEDWTQTNVVDGAPASVTNFLGMTLLDLGEHYKPCIAGFYDYGWKVGKSGTSTWLNLYKGSTFENTGFAREGFVVFNKHHDWAQVIASHDTQFRRGGSDAPDRFVSEIYSSAETACGQWSLDGIPHVFDKVNLHADEKLHLMSFRFRELCHPNVCAADQLCRSHWHWNYPSGSHTYGNSSGGCAIGEILYYDRVLTDRERADTERYLMRKWGVSGGLHPKDCAARRVVEMDCASGVDAVLDTEDTLDVSDLDVTGAIVKRGGGAAVVRSVAPDMTGFRAEGGSLSVCIDITKGAFFHVDASDESTFTYGDDYDPGSSANHVKFWHDVRRNGAYADATGATKFLPGNVNFVTKSLPVRKTVEINGVAKPCVDFGAYISTQDATEIAGSTAASMAWTVYRPFRTGFIVCADSAKLSIGPNPQYYDTDRQSIFGEYNMSFFRWSDPQIVGWYKSSTEYGPLQAPLASEDAYIGVNGEKKVHTWQVPFQTFHVFAFAPTSSVANVSSFGYSRGDRFGGQQVCEAIVFDTELSVETRSLIERHLMRKWLSTGEGAGDITLEVGEMSVENGASLAVTGDTAGDAAVIVTAPTLGGLGAVRVGTVNGVTALSAGDADEAGTASVSGDVSVESGATLAVTVDPAAGTVSTFAVGGTATFAGSVTVKLRTGDGSTGATVKAGFYPLVTASTLTADISDWTLDASCMGDMLDYRLVQRENAIGLLAMEAGLFIILE